jgi:CheY-like chemotaxis protein
MQGAQRGATLTQRMLAFARQQELKIEPHSLTKLVERADDLLHRSVGEKIELQLDIARAVPMALVDDNQFDLALLNLVINARDAMPGGGVITVAVDHRHSSDDPQAPEDGYVCLTVADDGHGMDQETLEKATQPFFSTKGIGKGSVLGLSMIHGLALQLNGKLHLESTVGKGTTAELWIPATSASKLPDDRSAAEPAAADCQRPLRILFVDDDVLISMSSVEMLEDLGHEVTAAYSGAKAVEILQAEPAFDLLITDFSMPKMNGGQLASVARGLYPDLPILLATGYAELPADDDLKLPKLSKPYLQRQLQAEIESVMKR